MRQPRAPHIEKVEAGKDFAALPQLRDTASIEISAEDLEANPKAQTIRMAAMMPDHFAAAHGEDAVTQIRGMPVYFRRTPTGLALHPRADKAYWIRVTYRAPVHRGVPPSAAT
jgi:hypothetical protein